MTIQEGSGLLYNWFYKHDSFCLEKDFLSLIPITDYPERDKAAIAIALDKLKDGGILASTKRIVENETLDYYILERTFDSWSQNVDINPTTARYISNEVNAFCEVIDDKTDWCDVTNLGEKDVRNLIHIINFYRQRTPEEPDNADGKKKG
jgi:hypothetical protein